MNKFGKNRFFIMLIYSLYFIPKKTKTNGGARSPNNLSPRVDPGARARTHTHPTCADKYLTAAIGCSDVALLFRAKD